LLLLLALTFKFTYDYKDEDTYFCTANIGWITGHSYNCYGTLANGGDDGVVQGVPTYPNPDRSGKLIEKYRVSIFYTAPTALRSLMERRRWLPSKTRLSSLAYPCYRRRTINPEAGCGITTSLAKLNVPIVIPTGRRKRRLHADPATRRDPQFKPGSATMPFFGIDPAISAKTGVFVSQ